MEELLEKIESRIKETIASSKKFPNDDARYVELFWAAIGLQTAKSIVEKHRLDTEKCFWTVHFYEPYAWSSEETIMSFAYNIEPLTHEEAMAKANVDFGNETGKFITHYRFKS